MPPAYRMEHLPLAQQLVFPLLSFDIMRHCLPSLPWQQSSPLLQSLTFAQQVAPFPQHAAHDVGKDRQALLRRQDMPASPERSIIG